jgi:ferredoxin
MLEELRTHLQQELRIPEIRGERCVHAHIEQASCHACVDKCPKQAWLLDDESLKINIEACDGCGLCAPACSQGAILHSHEPLLRQLDDPFLVALIACEKTELPLGQGVIPCLHALGLHDLLKLYRQGVRTLMLTAGNCQQCVRYSPATLQAALNTLNQALKQRGLMSILLHELSAEVWQQQRQTTKEPVSRETVSRRSFFRRGLQTALHEGLKLKGLLPQDSENFLPPGTLLPASATKAEVQESNAEVQESEANDLPYVPQINPTLCNGCDTCFKICPHEALLLDTDNPAYIIVPKQCTGCHLCTDVCTSKAINIVEWITPVATRIPLQKTRCRRCGVAYHHPVDYPATANLCHICGKTNHYQNLFQVLR